MSKTSSTKRRETRINSLIHIYRCNGFYEIYCSEKKYTYSHKRMRIFFSFFLKKRVFQFSAQCSIFHVCFFIKSTNDSIFFRVVYTNFNGVFLFLHKTLSFLLLLFLFTVIRESCKYLSKCGTRAQHTVSSHGKWTL